MKRCVVGDMMCASGDCARHVENNETSFVCKQSLDREGLFANDSVLFDEEMYSW